MLLSQPLERIKINEYGDCNGIGYVYIKKIVNSIPDPRMFPVVRYYNYSLFPHVLFSDSRIYYDDRILIGIDLGEDATHEEVISQAALKSVDINPPASTWAFQTVLDYDLLTGFVFHINKDLSNQPQNIEITLYNSAQNFVEIGHWATLIPAGQVSYTYKLEKPINHFSFGRGATDFIVKISSLNISDPSLIQIDNFKILGVKVDLSNYTIFNEDFGHNKRCFAAIKNSFFQEIQNSDSAEWKKYLKEVSNVGFGN